MSALTNDAFRLARMAGYYKGIQSAGAAVSFGMDAVKVCNPSSYHVLFPVMLTFSQTAYLTEALVSWLLILVSLPLCVIVLYQIRETNYDAEQTVHVDQSKQDRIGQPSASVARSSADA